MQRSLLVRWTAQYNFFTTCQFCGNRPTSRSLKIKVQCPQECTIRLFELLFFPANISLRAWFQLPPYLFFGQHGTFQYSIWQLEWLFLSLPRPFKHLLQFLSAPLRNLIVPRRQILSVYVPNALSPLVLTASKTSLTIGSTASND